MQKARRRAAPVNDSPPEVIPQASICKGYRPAKSVSTRIIMQIWAFCKCSNPEAWTNKKIVIVI